ncbi:hypothetical protein, partial [Escherichia coli]|uniref:hypothetical protein n=1 Tax=Escherichia coli TaxID=562 RepID=UPI001F4B769B
TDGDGSHGSTSKTPSYTKSVSWHHYRNRLCFQKCKTSEFGLHISEYLPVRNELMDSFSNKKRSVI